MSKAYTQKTAALKAVKIDANTLNARKILVYPNTGDKNNRTNIIDYISEKLPTEKIDNLENAINEFNEKSYVYTDEDNTLLGKNTFEKTIITEDGVHASGGDIVISNGVLTFEDLVDGTVVRRSGASGYQYVPGIPGNFENGVCYDIGEISDLTNLSDVRFTGEGTLVQTCELWFTTPATPPTAHQWPTDIYWIDSATGTAPTLIASKNYRIVLRQEPNKIIASIAYLY